MNYTKIKIFNGKIITPDRLIEGGSMVIAEGRILEVSERNIDAEDALQIDAAGKYISPGFIDIHVHGGGGHDFMDNTTDAFLSIAKTHAQYGTTAMTPTTLSCDKKDLLKTLELYKTAGEQNKEGAQFLGMHIEGPYFSMKQKGAQDARYIREPDPEEYKEIISQNPFVSRWSAAPELKGAVDFGRYLKSKGILAAIAHTDAVYEEVLEAYESGYTHATHFYSCMSGVSRRNAFRYAGVIESAYLIDDMSVEIIADGIHLPPPLLKLVYKIKGAGRTALITDAMRAAGMPPGESILGSIKDGMKVIVEDNVAKLPDRSVFAGSVATADRLVRNMIRLADIPLIDAVTMASLTPATIMKVDKRKGSLTAGKDADVVIFDENITIDTTIIRGKIVYKKK
ncbi:N-acetylglucosamine-6-phosphate deacetylase [Arcticibacter tournemirensis]|uniref:N-acetylglucosamine-6-phosphate deacetylase n=1 Tax=Arcticibacter tournemirensis TaxID=699437 RepID=A0A5M9H8B4_9SPHI|nr:N-acetylglucosamine-6-phosphate deacetylase [Arcticibacter tournemirensis]KAA8482860.1 N-acetylglucosamine-6-phosphate deacetylase [Arcticibacter tournemirensis]TQM49762.1 N-acetylglucosamine-6-phosphate deacetylase [Arcticibacter tournemirensis]